METILIVDDNDGDRKLMSMALTEQGYQVVEACNGKEALEAFQKHSGKIDLILTDILMPQMDGVHLVQRIRTIAPQMKVLFISGYKRRFKQEVGGHHVDFVEKSHDLSHLIHEVRRVLDETCSITTWFKRIFSIFKSKSSGVE